jgi:WhiB family transcriptional regulator, redox-sensing transcriptional regulator
MSDNNQYLCTTVDPGIFHSDNRGDINKARGICYRCNTRITCLADALHRGERWGVWGGVLMSSTQERLRARPALRAALRRRAGAAA